MTNLPQLSIRFPEYQDDVPTVLALKSYNLAKVKAGDTIKVTGLTRFNDGLGGDYVWDPLSTLVDDGINVVRPNTATVGRWIKIISAAAGVVSNSPGQATTVAPSQGLLAGTNGAANIGYNDTNTKVALDRINSTNQLDAFISGGLIGEYYQDATAGIKGLLTRGNVDNRDVAGHIHLPRGQYRQTETFKLPNSVVLSGDGRKQTKIQGFIDGNRPYPLMTNAEPGGALFQTIRDIGFWGGTSGYYINAPEGCDDIRFQDVDFFGQTEAGIVCERLFQTTELRNVEFNQCKRGIWVKEHTSNAVFIFGGAFKNLTEAALDLNGVEALVCVGTRFEGGGDPLLPGKATINLQNVRNISFVSCYFENTHGTLLRTRKSGAIGPTLGVPGSISFTNCHFTQAAGGGAYTWDVEDDPVMFTDCDSFTFMRLPPTAQVRGHNRNMLRTIRTGQLVSKQKAATPGQNFLLTFDLADSFPAVSNINVLTGKLLVTFGRIDGGGGGYTTFAREYLISLRSLAGLNLTGTVKLVTSDDMAGGATMDLAFVGATANTAQLVANIGGINAADPVRMLSWSVTWDQVASRTGNMYAIGLA